MLLMLGKLLLTNTYLTDKTKQVNNNVERFPSETLIVSIGVSFTFKIIKYVRKTEIYITLGSESK